MAFELDITAFKHVPWGGNTGLADIVVLGKDWSGASFNWGFGVPASGTTGFRLTTQAAGTQGVSATYDANYLHPTSGAIVGATTIRPQVDETTLEGLTFSGSADLELPHTLYIDPTDSIELVYCYGTMTIKQGVADS